MKAKVKDSHTISEFSAVITSITCDLQENLKNIFNAFEHSHESWNDKNADAAEQFLQTHKREMLVAINILERMSYASNKLSKIAEDYENV